jgi:hypothetical protein
MTSREFQIAENLYKAAKIREETRGEYVCFEEITEYENAIQKEFNKDPKGFIDHFFPTVKLRPWQEKYFIKNLNNPNLFGMVFSSGNNIGKTAIICISIIWALMCFPFSIVTSVVSDIKRGDSIKAEILKWVAKMEDPDLFGSIFVSNASEIYKKDPNTHKAYRSASEFKHAWCWKAEVAKSGSTIQGKRSDNSMFIVDEAGYMDSSVLTALIVNRIGRDEDSEINDKCRLQTIIICGNLINASGAYITFLTNPAVKKYMFVKNITEESGDLRKEDAMPAKRFLEDVYGVNSKEYQERVLSIKVPEYPIFGFDFLQKKELEVKDDKSIEELGICTFEYLLSDVQYNFPKNIFGTIYIGVDPAGFNGDQFAILARNDEKILWISYGNLKDPFMITKIISNLNIMFPGAIWCVEINGVGGNLPAVINTCGIKKTNIKPFYGTGSIEQCGGRSPARKFVEESVDLYTALVLAARDWMINGRLINCERLFNELRQIGFCADDGKNKVNKALFKKEYGKSPDLLDAFAHSFIVGKGISVPDKEKNEKIRMRNLGCLTMI